MATLQLFIILIMSTTSKGDRFELKTQKLLTQVLRNGKFELKLEGESEFWIVPKDSDVFNKKKYKYVYGSKVVIDVSIESINNYFNDSDISEKEYLHVYEGIGEVWILPTLSCYEDFSEDIDENQEE